MPFKPFARPDRAHRVAEPAALEALESRALPAALPVVVISVSDPVAAELPRKIGEFSISRSGSILEELTVHYTIGGTATNGVDFTPLSTQITIPAGRRSITLPIIPIDDVLVEGDETAVVTLARDTMYKLDPTGRNRSASITITDDDSISRVTIGSYI